MNRLKEARKAKGLTQMQVAALIGISQNGYSNWETGRNRIDNESLAKLSALFDVSADYLLGRDEAEKKSTPAASATDVDFDDFTYAMYNESRELTEENRQKLLEMARFFKQQQDKP